jgi:cytochrome c oxidase subunit 2
MSVTKLLTAAAALPLAVVGAAANGFAASPQPWQMGFQPSVTPMMDRIVDFHDLLLIVTSLITAFVLGLLLYVIVRFNAKSNPTPTRTSHNTILELFWTVVPVIILVAIAVPSFKLLYYQETVPETEMTIKVNGQQWFWSYTYPDHGDFTFDSVIVPDEDIKEGQLRLLEVDNRVVVPVNTNIRLLLTATNVLHAWAVPAFGIKIDTVPGQVNETWVRVTREGTYFGQCSELCGVGHGYMPIAVDVVSIMNS